MTAFLYSPGSYDTWIRCLTTGDRRNICPITKKPLSKRELVVLTEENIEQYRWVQLFDVVGCAAPLLTC